MREILYNFAITPGPVVGIAAENAVSELGPSLDALALHSVNLIKTGNHAYDHAKTSSDSSSALFYLIYCQYTVSHALLLSFHSVDELSGSSSGSYANSWISWFLASKGSEYFCEVDDEYITDRFNLTGLNAEVQGYSAALELITDTSGE